MSKATETQHQATNSYTSIIRSSGPSKTGCAKCDSIKLPNCVCSQSGSEENESEEKFSAPSEQTKNIDSMQQISHFSIPNHNSSEEANKERSILVLFGPQKEFQFTLKPNVKLTDIKILLEQFIRQLAHNVNVDANIKELGKNVGVYYDGTHENTLAITITHPKHFVEFCTKLLDKELIVIKPEEEQQIEKLTREENGQSFNPNPFTMTLTPFKR